MSENSRPRTAILWVVVLAYGGFMAWRSLRDVSDANDFHGWWVASQRLFAGDRVYFPQLTPDAEMPNKHGLLLLVLFRPLSLLEQGAAQAIWVLLSAACLGHTLVMLCASLGRVSPVVIGLLMVAPFVHTHFKYEQTGVFLLWLIVLGLRWVASGRRVVGGACFGCAAAIKLLPVVFLPWLLYTRRFGAAVGFVAGVLLAVLVPSVLFGFGAVQRHLTDYADMLRQDAAASSQHRFHQSLRPLVLASIAPRLDAGPLASEQSRDELARWEGMRNFAASERLFAWREWIVSGLAFAFALLCAWAIPFGRGSPDSDRITGEVGLVLATMVLISPLAWKHYFVWLLPAAAWLAATRGIRRGLGLAVFALTLTLPHKGVLGSHAALVYQTFHGYAAGLAVVVVLLASWMRASRTGDSRSDARSSARVPISG